MCLVLGGWLAVASPCGEGKLMGKPLVNDELWELIQPLLPPPKPRRQRYPGRKPLSERRVLTGVLFVLKSGIPWEMLPQEMRCGSGLNYLDQETYLPKYAIWMYLGQQNPD